MNQSRKALSTALNVADEKALVTLEHGLVDATGYHVQVGHLSSPGIALKELSQQVEGIRNLLRKIARNTASTEQNIKQVSRKIRGLPSHIVEEIENNHIEFARRSLDEITDDYYQAVDDFRLESSTLIHRIVDKFPDDAKAGIDLKPEALLLADVFNTYLSGIKTPGKGGLRQQAKQQKQGIICLARWFKDALPDHPLSSKENSIFSRYVIYWMKFSLNIELPAGENIKRRIESAIKNDGK